MRQLPIRSVLESLPNAPRLEPYPEEPAGETSLALSAPEDLEEGIAYARPGENPPLDHLAWYAVLFAQTTFPHAQVAGSEFQRRNGNVSLSLLAPAEIGLPYGVYPRLILIWLTTQTRDASNHVELPWTFQAFADQLGLGTLKWGAGASGPRLKDQLIRLIHLSVRARLSDASQHHDAGAGFHIASRYSLWWDTSRPTRAASHANYIELSAEFSRLVEKRYPIDLKLVRRLALPSSRGGRGACLSLDLYLWLAQRCYSLKRPLSLSWDDLAQQLGSDYGRVRDLGRKLRERLPDVLKLYPLRVDLEGDRLIVHPPTASLLRSTSS